MFNSKYKYLYRSDNIVQILTIVKNGFSYCNGTKN